jgi:deoxyribodipyrimidine photo-lyase
MPAKKTSDVVVLWFRRDLRIEANAAVAAAAVTGVSVLPLFILDPTLRGSRGANRLAFLYEALESLRASGVPLVLCEGSPTGVLSAINDKLKIHEIICAHDYAPAGASRDLKVEAAMSAAVVPLRRVGSPYVVDPGTVRKDDGTPFKVFTTFKRVWARHLEKVLAVPVPKLTNIKKVTWCTDP